jgi:hypothetical protein
MLIDGPELLRFRIGERQILGNNLAFLVAQVLAHEFNILVGRGLAHDRGRLQIGRGLLGPRFFVGPGQRQNAQASQQHSRQHANPHVWFHDHSPGARRHECEAEIFWTAIHGDVTGYRGGWRIDQDDLSA